MKPKRKSKPGILTWAWLGLICLVVVSAALVHMLGERHADENAVTLAINGSPERFAPETGSAEIPQDMTGADDTDVSEVESAASESDVQSAEDAMEREGDSATVIRLDDLPAAGERKPQQPVSSLQRPAGIPPPPPDTALTVATEEGKYPRISADGRKASEYYRRSYNDPADRPRIAILVAGLGLSTDLTAQAINELPPEITLAFAPYARDLPQWTSQARNAGHELMIELPMESAGVSVDALGPAALLSSRTPAQNRQRLNWILSRFEGYFGVTNYLGGRISDQPTAITPIYDQIRQAGLAFVADTEIAPLGSGGSGLSVARTDILIGSGASVSEDELSSIEKVATDRGAVLVKVYPTQEALTALSVWASSLEDKGIVLAPASTMLP